MSLPETSPSIPAGNSGREPVAFLATFDKITTHTNPWAFGTATLVNGSVLALLLLLGLKVSMQPGPKMGTFTDFKLSEFPLFAPAADSAHGGGGGGASDTIDANRGRLPKLDMHPLAPVQQPVLENPKLAVENRIAVQPEIKLPDNPALPMIGMHDSPNVTLMSGGQGTHGGIGIGSDDGMGPGHGPGWGPGSNGGAGNGIYTPGVGGVTQPVPIFTPEAEFSDEARRQKYQGVCMISVIIDAQGSPQSPHVVRALGMGLDEKALQAVMRYRFKPAKKDGRPVAVRMIVEVNFRLY
jgi:periplasmic protein TonB